MRHHDQRQVPSQTALGAGVFEQPLSLLPTLMFNHSQPRKVYDFLAKEAGTNPRYWAKIIFPLVLFWNDGSRQIDPDMVNLVPKEVLASADKALRGADTSEWGENEKRAASTFLAQCHPEEAPGRAPSDAPQEPTN